MKFPWAKPVNKAALVEQTFAELETASPEWRGGGDIINAGEVTCELKGSPVTIRWGYTKGPEYAEWATMGVVGERAAVTVDLVRNDAVHARIVAHRALRQIRQTSTSH